MRFAGRVLAVAALLVAATSLVSVGARAQARYTYTIIHDLGVFTQSVHGRSAAINNAGQVAFILDDGGIYRGDGGSLTQIYKMSVVQGAAVAPGKARGELSLNDSGAVAFHASKGLEKYIALGDGNAPATVVAGWPGFAAVSFSPSINNAGEVAFANAATSAGSEVWVVGGGTSPRRIAYPGMSLDGETVRSALSPTINNSGEVAFTAQLNTSWNVYRSNSGVAIATIATGVDHVLAHINSSGIVVFGHGLQGLGIGSGGPVDHIMPPPTRSVHRSYASLNDAGEVAFEAGGYPNGAQGLFVGTATESWPVAQPGDTIPGLGTVVNAYIGDDAQNNRGQVAFTVEYKIASDTLRRHAFVRADPIDVDSDDDGVPDDADAFPHDPSESSDYDRDGIGDNADTDDDNDGQADADEIACGSNPRDSASQSPDRDFDGLPDCVDDHAPPQITVPSEMTVEATGPSGAPIAYQVSAVDDRDPQPSVACAPASGATFPLGETTVRCTAADASGNTAVGHFIIRVVDTTAPSIGDVRPSGLLWPPNGKMVAVSLTVTATDTVDSAPACMVTGVTANEAIDASDWALDGPLALQLRARRSGDLKEGRIYTVSIRCVDASQNAAVAVATFVVAHDQRR